MRHAGRITGWNDGKGFGFVTPHDGGARAFLHVKAFQHATRRPLDDDLVSYATRVDAKGRLNAIEVRFAGQRIAAPAKKTGRVPMRIPRVGIAVAFLLVNLAAVGLLWYSGIAAQVSALVF